MPQIHFDLSTINKYTLSD